MLAGTPSSLAASSFSPIERPPSQAFPTKYQLPILPPNFPRNPPPSGQPSISSGPPVNGQPFTSHMPPTRPPLNGPPIQHPFLSQPSIPPGPPANSQPSISHMPPTHPPLNVSAVQYPSLSQPSMGPNGMSQSPTHNMYPNSRLPSPLPNQMHSTSFANNPLQPPISNQPLANMNNPQPYQPNHYANLSGPLATSDQQMNGHQLHPNQKPRPQSRIDPEMIPNVIQVLEEKQEQIQTPFITNAPGLLPPLVNTDFLCQDQGSCNPRLMRSTVYAIPSSADMIKQSQLPLALAISPLADVRSDELEPPLAQAGDIGPIRCHRCKAYMCSFMKFIDGGKRFVCCFCEAATDVPNEYFNHLDHSGRRVDWHQRAELCLGSYEILATKQYCKNEKYPEPPAFIFMIDVSYNSIRSGLAEYVCHILKNDLLDYLPKDKNAEVSKVRIGFATYDKQIHFYNIKSTLGQPQMMVVSDLEDIFVPLQEGFLCSPSESRGVINSLLDQIPQTFAKSQKTETILAPVIQSGLEALKGANCSGKIYIFSASLPIATAPGKLSNRDDRKMLGTDKEKVLLTPINDIYTKLGEECAQHGCAVDLFVFPNNYYDLATIGEVCRVSGGEIYKYNYFSIDSDGERLYAELKRNFQRTTVFDGLMRVRTSSGIRPVDFLGNFYMTNTTEMVFGTMDADKSVSIELKHDDKLPADSNIYAQVALLYTSIAGQRRLRILTLALTATSSYTPLYLSCDLDTILNYVTKVATRSVLVSTPKSIRDNIIDQAVNMLACYRKNCSQSAPGGQLILPETLKLLPVYAASLIKSEVLTGAHTISTDDRSWLIHRIMSLNIKGTSVYLYPRIYPLHTLDEDHLPPRMVRCSYERLSDTGAYLFENGFSMYLWLGGQIYPNFVQHLFGVQTVSQIQPEKCRVMELDNSISNNVRSLLNMIRNERNCYMKFSVIQKGGIHEPFFKNQLVEDKGFSGGASYVDILYHLHREIRNVLQ